MKQETKRNPHPPKKNKKEDYCVLTTTIKVTNCFLIFAVNVNVNVNVAWVN